MYLHGVWIEYIAFMRISTKLSETNSNSSQRLPARFRVGIKIRRFSQTTHTVSSPCFRVVVRRAVPGRPVIPDSHVIAVPSEPDLGVVVLRDELWSVSLYSG